MSLKQLARLKVLEFLLRQNNTNISIRIFLEYISNCIMDVDFSRCQTKNKIFTLNDSSFSSVVPLEVERNSVGSLVSNVSEGGTSFSVCNAIGQVVYSVKL